jgi:PHD/YefM family antitoxin component YafN of YafNO toxin-antitoxin module
MTTKTIDATDLRNNLSDAMSSVGKGQTLIVKKRGQLKVAMIDLDSYEDLLAASDPDTLKQVQEARNQYKNGDTVAFDEVFSGL